MLIPGGKRIEFLLGADGEPWTWVLGEHQNDRSIDDILEEEAQEKAQQLAEKEAEELRSVTLSTINQEML